MWPRYIGVASVKFTIADAVEFHVDGMARTNDGRALFGEGIAIGRTKIQAEQTDRSTLPSHGISMHRLLLASGINRGFFPTARARTHTRVRAYCCARNNILVVVTRLIKIVSPWIKESAVIWLLILIRTLFRSLSRSLSLFPLIRTRNMRTMEIVANSKNISVIRYWRKTKSCSMRWRGFPEDSLERNWQRCCKTAESFLDYTLHGFNLDRVFINA